MVIQKLPSLAADQNKTIQPLKPLNPAQGTANQIQKTATNPNANAIANFNALKSTQDGFKMLPNGSYATSDGLTTLTAEQYKNFNSSGGKSVNAPSSSSPPIQQAGQPAMQTPNYKAPDPFQFNYNYLNYDTAKQRAEERYNPLFEQAVKGVNEEKYQNELDSGQSAANRGLAHSGLAQDALTKLAIASQGQIANLNAQKMTNVADYSQSLLDKDQDRGDRLRSQMYNEYSDNRNFGYNQYRDQVGDFRYADETKYNRDRDTKNDAFRDKQTAFENALSEAGLTGMYNGKQTMDAINNDRNFKLNESGVTGTYNGKQTYQARQDDRNFNYQVGRDKRDDFVDDRNFNYGKSQDSLANQWKEREWNSMSKAELQRAALDLQNSLKLKKASGGGGGGDYSNAVTENLPPLPDDILKQVLQAMQGNNATAISNNGRGFGQVPRTNSPDSKKARPMAY